ncbi:hypothetical protein DPEC_G00217110, partial [Dallia pectoralis]
LIVLVGLYNNCTCSAQPGSPSHRQLIHIPGWLGGGGGGVDRALVTCIRIPAATWQEFKMSPKERSCSRFATASAGTIFCRKGQHCTGCKCTWRTQGQVTIQNLSYFDTNDEI